MMCLRNQDDRYSLALCRIVGIQPGQMQDSFHINARIILIVKHAQGNIDDPVSHLEFRRILNHLRVIINNVSVLNYLSMTLKILQHIYLNIDGVIVQFSLLHFCTYLTWDFDPLAFCTLDITISSDNSLKAFAQMVTCAGQINC